MGLFSEEFNPLSTLKSNLILPGTILDVTPFLSAFLCHIVLRICVISVVYCKLTHINPFAYDAILDSSKWKEFADDNFEFEKSGSKFSKQVENTVGNEQFLLFHLVFKGLVLQTCKKQGLFGKGLMIQQNYGFI